MLQIGSLVDGKYKILNKVGQGGMSVVYLAMNEKANKQWAVKEVRKDGVLDFEAVKQGLVAETDILKRLDHPYLPSIIDVIDTDESFIIIMDYIQGNSLNKALDEFGAQPQDEVIKWAKQLCDVLGYLHTRTPPIIYRDMKPANVMLKPDGNISLIDFGTAREYKEKNLADTTCLGTVGYAAPEQFGGMGQTDARTDIYCLGATLYHLVTGKNPCEPLKCTQRDPNDRYQSAAELMYALEHYEEVDDSYRKKQKRKLALFLAPVVLALLFAGASVWGYLSAEKQRTADYDFILAEAANESDPTTALSRYYEAITTDPTRTDAYLGNDDFSGMIDYLTRDGELTVSESSWLSRLKAGLDQKGSSGYSSTVDVLAELRAADPSGYEQVCYEIGEAYLFYYSVPVEKDRYAAAATWFQYAKEGYPIADMYCQISACLQNIAKYEKSEQHAKLYEEYQSLWSQILKLKTDANDFDDDLKLRIWNEITNMIQNNAKAFCEVTPPEEILAAIDEISADSEKITNTFLEKSVSTLRENIAATTNKILSYAETAE